MPDLTGEVLPRLEAHRLPDLDLGRGSFAPAYHGYSLLNLPASLARWLGATDLPHPGIPIPQLEVLAGGVSQVIVCLIDAVGLGSFRRWLEGPLAALQPLVEGGLLIPLTSVAPSTTSVALTTLWTGRSPAEHGVLGYELLLREYGLVANMATHSPVAFPKDPGSLAQAGFDPATFLTVPTLGPRFRQAGVSAYAFVPAALTRSGLSRLHFPEVEVRGYSSSTQLWEEARALAETFPRSRRFIWIYTDSVDALAHHAGPGAPEVAAEAGDFVQAMSAGFIEPLSAAARQGTLFLCLGDHGQIATRIDPHYDMEQHPSLLRRLHLPPTGESRLAYLYIRPGQTEAVAEYMRRAWPGAFQLLPSSLALEAGLFGPGEPAAEAAARIGDRIVLALGDAYLWWPRKVNDLRGQHGGLSSDEMLVPLLAARLD